MKKSLFFKLLCVFSFVFGLFSVSTVFSDYIIDKTTYDENGTLPNKATSVNDNGEKVTVTLKYQTIESKSAPDFAECFDENNQSFGTESKKINVGDSLNTKSDEYNRLKNFLKDHAKDNPFTSESLRKQTYRFFGRDGDSKYGKIEFELHVTKEIKHSQTSLGGHFVTNWYSGEYYMLARDYTKTIYKTTDLSNASQLSMRKNTSIDYSYLRNNLNNPDSTKYEFCGLKEVSSDGSVTDNYFDMSNPITSNITLCAVFQNKKELSLNLSEITTTINNTARNATIEFFKGAPSGRDISKDPGYNEKENIVYLGTSSLKTTVQAGATIRFNMNNGKEKTEFKEMKVDTSNKNFEPEDGQHERQYTVALANDLIVNGAFTIGGNFGNFKNAAKQGHIYNEYVCLDLNGHDIFVNSGGSLWFYGLVKDSVGTGHIDVNGGTIYTLATIMDYRGGGFTLSAINANVFPFIYYGLPYLRTKVVFNYTNSGWGKLVAFCRVTVQETLDIGDASHSQFELNFIGSGDTFLFKLNNGEVGKSRFIFDGYKINNVSINMCIQQRVGITVENAYLSMNKFKFTIASVYPVDTMKYNFPVNPFIDIRLVNSTIVFCQRIQFMAGMSFIADKDSTVIFTTNGDYSAQLSILDKGANYYDNKMGKLITTDNSGDIYSYEGNIQNNENFWKYYSQPKIKIYGKLLFTKGNTSSKKYKLVGLCDFNEDNIGTIDGSNITMYDKTKYSDPFTFLNQNGVSIQTYGFDYQISYDAYHVRGFSRPLVSNGKAYAVDDKDVKIGTYSFNDGIFKMDNGDCYYFNNDGNFALGDTAGNTMKQCTVTNNIIDDNGTKYIYFASMYGQYDSAASTVNLSRISNNATAVKVFYSRDAERWLRG